MTDDRIALKALIEQASDRELLAGMLGLVAEKLMALDGKTQHIASITMDDAIPETCAAAR